MIDLKEKYINMLKAEMMPAMGCTEPAASALAGAKAKEVFGTNRIDRILIRASRDMVKNAMGVGLPGCSDKGISVAVCLGIAIADTSKGLSILSSLTEEEKIAASKMTTELELADDVPPVFIEVIIEGDGHSAKTIVSGEHDRFSLIEFDGKTLLELPLNITEKTNTNGFDSLSLDSILEFVSEVSEDDLSFISNAINTNYSIASHAIKHGYGLEVGKTMMSDVSKEPHSLSEAMELGACYAAAGSDARMSGCSMPVIINSGSGNQGMTVTVPVAIVANYLKTDSENMLKAVAISELVGLMLTAKKNRLSALCGAFTAAIGTACAWVYLLGGDKKTMESAINNMVGNITGIICDGAKNTCAMKIYTCLMTAKMSVKLAMKGFCPDHLSGIVGDDSEESIQYLSRISNEGMKETDRTILSIMLSKEA